MLLHLLASGADVKARLWGGRTCLHAVLDNFWAWRSLKDVLLILLAAGADLFALDDKGDSVIDLMARHVDKQAIFMEVLIEIGHNPEEVVRYNRKSPFFRKHESFFMSQAHKIRPTILKFQELLQQTERFVYKEEANGHTAPETIRHYQELQYWYEIEEDSDSDCGDWDNLDEWQNDYEAEEKYICVGAWNYYQHPVKAQAYPNRHVERRRLEMPHAPGESQCGCDVCQELFSCWMDRDCEFCEELYYEPMEFDSDWFKWPKYQQ